MADKPVHSLTISKVVNDGMGLGYLDGKAVFVARTLPGDFVTVSLYKRKKVLFGRLQVLETPSPLRGKSGCTHFPSCGGCHYMDVCYEDQLSLKRDILLDTLTYYAPSLVDCLAEIVPSTVTTYHRNKMEFAFSMQEGSLCLGLKKTGYYDVVVPITDCLLLSKDSNVLLAFTQSFFTEHSLPVYDSREQVGCLRHLMIRHSKDQDCYMVNLCVAHNDPVFVTYAKALMAAFPQVTSVNVIEINEKKGQPTTTRCIHLAGDTVIEERLGNLVFSISPLAFFQTNTAQAVTLYEQVKHLCTINASSTVLDLYCGTGTIGLYVAQTGCQLIGIEENDAAILNARDNAAKNNITNATFITGRVKNILKFQSFSADCVIVDPPRSGLVPKALMRVAALKSPQLIYVSCNPVTLVRDLLLFQEQGYQVETIIPVDMFAHTYHLECVVKLTLH